MKKQIRLAVAILALGAGAAYAAAGAGTGVLGSVHDMRNSATVGATDFDGNNRVCAFCHTPHHAQTNVNADDYYPLWSRQIDTNTFDPYRSATINAVDYAADIAIGPTRLCMSCHDGSIAPDQHYGRAGGAQKLTDDSFGKAGVGFLDAVAGTGNGLTNDHPVGFNYNDIAAGPAINTDDTAGNTNVANKDNWIRSATGGTLVYKGNAANITVQSRLYQDQYMTCATCHDVHNRKNVSSGETANYLVLAPQSDSQLCLTCHIK
jgi:cytochrome c553